jgi:hypothetical protein
VSQETGPGSILRASQAPTRTRVTPRRVQSLRTAHSSPTYGWRCGLATTAGIAAGAISGFTGALIVARTGGLL